MNRVLCGDVLAMLATIPSDSVDCVVTSPPYWGLRDYGTDPIEWPKVRYSPMAGLPEVVVPSMVCSLGLEPTPEAFIGHLVLIFREVRRVLKPSGTCWVNMGDTYASAWSCGRRSEIGAGSCDPRRRANRVIGQGDSSLKEKDLCMIPARMALAFQADGFYCRQDIIWAKPNPMPESVRDRCTKSHEYVFLLTKEARYFYDHEAIKEPFAESSVARLSQSNLENQAGSDRVPGKTNGAMKAVGALAPSHKGSSFNRGKTAEHQAQRASDAPREDGLGRNKRSVWEIATQPYKEAHFAVFPEELARTCILAGCPEGGVVLDPFAGSGTTLSVAVKTGRQYLGIELNPKYVRLIERRLSCLTPALDLFREPETECSR